MVGFKSEMKAACNVLKKIHNEVDATKEPEMK
jgi:hypothetical protein